MRQWQLVSPETPAQWQQYYQLRWQVLRAPWQQPPGSEQDALEAQAHHLMLVTSQGDVVATGRIHQLDAETAQVRYMAVADSAQGKGAGSRILAALEAKAVAWGCSNVRLNARDSAQAFYQRYGYRRLADAPTQFGIVHHQMQKKLRLAGSDKLMQHWCNQLENTWRETIPLSQFMQLQIAQFDGNTLSCTAPLAPNINLHQTMFAGSIYALATLTGWGMLYLQLQALGLKGDQVLAEGNIRYFKPLAKAPRACCSLQHCHGDLSALANGRKVQQQISVQLYSEDVLAAEFTGRYAVLPAKEPQK